ncbi:MAG: protein kinase, partial [Planctomycetota bacterium]|nr:protein kinase [Planctomycetota bacterium]
MPTPNPIFTLERELGRGSSAVVWLGHLTSPLEQAGDGQALPAGSPVAVKILPPAASPEEGLRRRAALDREATAGRAVSHANLAAVLARGQDSHGAYLVQEFIPGRSLQEVLAEDGPLPEPLLRSTLRQLSAALATLHGAGWRHGDIKPANIRLDADGRAVLIDLGYAEPLAEPAPGAAPLSHPRAGTPAYLAPEQARGQQGGSASDIFSLGVCAWQLATGTHPFSADPGSRSSTEISLRATSDFHAPATGPSSSSQNLTLATDPDELLATISAARFTPPSRLVPQLSPFLDLLLEELLAPTPAQRPQAAELRERLEDQESGSWWRRRVSFSAAARRGSRGEGAAVEFAPLVGRTEELQRLQTAWSDRHTTPFLWIEGQAGMGTSRLAHAFATRIRLAAAQIDAAQVDAEQVNAGQAAAAPIDATQLDTEQAAAGQVDTVPVDAEQDAAGRANAKQAAVASAPAAAQSPGPPLFLYSRCRRLEEDRPCQPVLRLLQRWLRLPRATAPGPREVAQLAELLPPSTASALAVALSPRGDEAPAMAIPEALARWLEALARNTPLLVFIDDIQRADEATLAVLSRLARNQSAALLCLLGARTDAIPRRPAALADLRRATGGEATRLPLPPLTEGALRTLVDALFPPAEPRAPLARALWQRTLGNPGVAIEILRDLLARGEIEPTPDGYHLLCAPEDLPLPRSLEEALRQRLAALETSERLWLQRLAVAAPHLGATFLARAFHSGGPQADQTSQAIGIEQLLARLSALGWLIPAGRRYRFALPAARELVYANTRPSRLRRLHAAVAAALAPPPQQRSSLGDAFNRAWHLRRARQNGPLLDTVRRLLPLVRERGQHTRVHRLCLWGLQALDVEGGAESGPEVGAEVDAQVGADGLLSPTTEQESGPGGSTCFEPGAPPTAERATTQLRLELLEAAADSADRLGHRERQREVLERLAELDLDPKETPDLAGRVYLLHGRQAAADGRLGLARGLYRNAAELFESAGHDHHSSEAKRRLALIQSQVGNWEEARALARRAGGLATDGPQQAAALIAEGVIDVLEDQLEEALSKASRAAALLRRATRPASPERLRHLGTGAAVHLLRARAWRQAGRRLRALAAARRALRTARAAGEVRLEIECLARQGALLLDTDQVEPAEDSLREALVLARRLDDRRGQALAGIFLGILLTEAG